MKTQCYNKTYTFLKYNGVIPNFNADFYIVLDKNLKKCLHSKAFNKELKAF